MDKLRQGFIVALVAVVAALGLYATLSYTRTMRTALVQATADAKKAQETVKKTQATLALREAARKASEAKAASAEASLEAVLANNKTWADAPVPQEVQDDLCKTLRCDVGHGADSVRSSDDSP